MKRTSLPVLLPFGLLLLPGLATASISAPYLDDLLLQLTLYPYVALGLALLIYKLTDRRWTFLLAPLFFFMLFSFAPLDEALERAPLFGAISAWLYLPHVAAVLAAYFGGRKASSTWPFFLTPPMAWVIQVGVVIAVAQ